MAAAAPLAAASPAALVFGIITDMQYADAPDGAGFSGADRRAFRASLGKAALAARAFAAARAHAVMQLGDIVDGRSCGERFDGLAPAGTSVSPAGKAAAAAAVRAALDALRGGGAGGDAAAIPMAHLRGNHENYVATAEEQATLLPLPDVSPAAREFAAGDGGARAFSFAPAAGWRFIALDAYAESLAARAGSAARAAAAATLRANNDNLTWDGAPCDFFKGRAGPARRFVPFNGALGAAQRGWLRGELAAARAARERACVFTHVPLLPAAARRARGAAADAPAGDERWDCCAFDFEEALAALGEFRDVVAAVFAGHDHEGSFGVDAAGIPHVTLAAPLVSAGEPAHAIVYARADHLELEGAGTVPSRRLDAPCWAGAAPAEAAGE